MRKLLILITILVPISSVVVARSFSKRDFSKAIGSYAVSGGDGRGLSKSNINVSNTGQLSAENSNGKYTACYYKSPNGTFTKTVGSAWLCPKIAKQ
jgi:hypothetical protein